jgi:hypothetical protein
MDNSHVQHYISSLHGYLNAGEAVMLDKEFQVTNNLCLKVTMILGKQECPSSGLIINLYVFPRQNGIQVPWITAPRKRMYIRYPSEKVLQTT